MFKKSLAAILAATMVFSLVGCGSSSTSVKTDYGTVKLTNYKGLTAYKDDCKVTDDEVQSTIDSELQAKSTTETIKKGKVENDSTVIFDYTGKIEVDGKKVKFDGGAATDQTADIAQQTVGGNPMIDGFVDALKGHKVGETFTAKLQFPKTYTNKAKVGKKEVNLAKKDVWFTYKIKSLQKTNVPELNDEFVKKNYKKEGLSTVKAYKAYQKKQLQNNKIMNQVWTDYVASCKVEKYDDKKLKEYESEVESQIVAQYSSYGVTSVKNYLDACGITKKEWTKQLKEQIKSRMVLLAVASEEKLDGDKLYKEEGNDYAKKYYGSDIKTLEQSYGKDTVKEALTYSLLSEKISNVVCDSIKWKSGAKPTTTTTTTTAEETTTEAATEKATKKAK